MYKPKAIIEKIKKYLTILNIAYTLFFLHAAYIIKHVWTNLDLFQFDHAGHIASAKLFSQGYFHTFQDAFFKGNIQNLFYPPLQEAILSFISLFTGDFVTSYYVYLSILIISLFLTLVFFTHNFDKAYTKILFLGVMSIILFISKDQLNFMGLGWYDLFVYGLANQFLGYIFLLFLLDGLLQRRAWIWLVLLTVLTSLSHLVIGLAAFSTLTVYAVMNADKDAAKTIGVSFGILSFFILPFLIYKEYMVSNILIEPLSVFFMLFLFLLLPTVSFKNNKGFLIVTAVLLSLPGILDVFIDATSLFQTVLTTHYTRFSILALHYAVIYTFFIIDKSKRISIYKNISVSLSLIFLVLTLTSFTYFNVNTQSPETFTSKSEDIIKNFSTDGNTHIIHKDRQISFHIDMHMNIVNPHITSTKGLFWESTRNNNILNSYLTTLHRPEGAMLYHHYLTEPNCDQISCVNNQFITDYAVQQLIIPGKNATLNTDHTDNQREACYTNIIQEGTDMYTFTETHTVKTNKQTFTVYNVTSTNTASNTYIDIPRNGYVNTITNDEWGFMPATTDIFECSETQNIFLREKNHELPQYINQTKPENISFTKTGKATYNITIQSNNTKIFRIKQNYLPGMILTQNGDELPLYDASHYMVGVGKGTMQLTYKKPILFHIAYILTIMNILLLAYIYLATHKKTRCVTKVSQWIKNEFKK